MMTNNRPEFIPIDMAAVSLGGVPFSIYQTSSPEQIAYVLSDAGAKIAIVEAAFLEVFNQARKELPDLETLIVIDGEGGEHTLEELEAMDPEFDLGDPRGDRPDDLLTLIYTSGTTGPPKGVQLTHRNLMTLVGGIEGMIDFPERGAKVISWLPTAHIADRGAHYYLPVMLGAIGVRLPRIRATIIDFLPKVRPTFFFAVPRIWEKLKAGLEAKLGSDPRGGGREGQAGPRGGDPEGEARAGRRGGSRAAGRGRRRGR